MLQKQLSGKTAFPAVAPNTLYFVLLPPGVSVVAAATARARRSAATTTTSDTKIFYAVVPYPTAPVAW